MGAMIRAGAKGPGSRGGKVIGTTKSGKPIYDKPGHEAHAGFTGANHREASDLHGRLGREADRANRSAAVLKHIAAGRDHEEAAKGRTDTGGEGSRGGKVIGHTGSGKPIYMSHSHKAHNDFTAADHDDARAVHQKLERLVPVDDPDRLKKMNKHGAAQSDHATSADFARAGQRVPKAIKGRRITRV